MREEEEEEDGDEMDDAGEATLAEEEEEEAEDRAGEVAAVVEAFNCCPASSLRASDNSFGSGIMSFPIGYIIAAAAMYTDARAGALNLLMTVGCLASGVNWNAASTLPHTATLNTPHCMISH